MNSQTLLLRQIHPNFAQDGRVTSQAFTPTPKDRQSLSVYDGDQITARDAWDHYVDRLNYGSMGVMAVSVLECGEQQLSVKSDPDPFPQHCIIIFGDLAKHSVRNTAKRLAEFANKRGWQYGPVS